MELVRCANCLTVYGDLQDECPQCEANNAGEGAAIEFDGTARSAIADLGGVYGGILEGNGNQVVLWCEYGVCCYDPVSGLVWRSEKMGKVDDVSVAPDAVRVTLRRNEFQLNMEDGAVVEAPQ